MVWGGSSCFPTKFHMIVSYFYYVMHQLNALCQLNSSYLTIVFYTFTNYHPSCLDLKFTRMWSHIAFFTGHSWKIWIWQQWCTVWKVHPRIWAAFDNLRRDVWKVFWSLSTNWKIASNDVVICRISKAYFRHSLNYEPPEGKPPNITCQGVRKTTVSHSSLTLHTDSCRVLTPQPSKKNYCRQQC